MEISNKTAEILNRSRKIVIKVGTNTLSREDGSINRDFVHNLAEQIAELLKQNKQVVLVSSGARICGVSSIGKWKRKEDIHYKQALCAIGQVELMNSWKEFFKNHRIPIGQLLLTREDFGDAIRTLNIRNTLFTLVDEGVVPIVNENDSISVEEIKIGDNDNLAALTACLWNADLLVLLSDIDGVYDKNPRDNASARLLRQIKQEDPILKQIETGASGSFGTGGIASKIEAARRVNSYGIPMILANGKTDNIIRKIEQSETESTLFLTQEEHYA